MTLEKFVALAIVIGVASPLFWRGLRALEAAAKKIMSRLR